MLHLEAPAQPSAHSYSTHRRLPSDGSQNSAVLLELHRAAALSEQGCGAGGAQATRETTTIVTSLMGGHATSAMKTWQGQRTCRWGSLKK